MNSIIELILFPIVLLIHLCFAYKCKAKIESLHGGYLRKMLALFKDGGRLEAFTAVSFVLVFIVFLLSMIGSRV